MSDKIVLRPRLDFSIFPRWEIVLIKMWKIILASLGWLLFIVIGNVLYISEGCYTFKLGLIGGGIQVLMFGVVLIVVSCFYILINQSWYRSVLCRLRSLPLL